MRAKSSATEASVTVHLDRRSPMRRIWRYVGYDEPNYTYTPSGKTLLTKLADMADAPYSVRCHFILCTGDGAPRLKWGSTNIYTEDGEGRAVYTWDIIDRILDSYVALGLVPFIELGFTPEALSTAPEGTIYDDPRHGGWRYPPRDYGRWLELVRTLAEHCVQRYGLAEVSRWYWELWNEPDIFYWAGTTDEYCRLYDYTEAGLHSALPQARIGGPATTSSVSRAESSAFLRAFLEHVTHGVNYLTGKCGTRIDFVSYHAKGGSFGADPNASKATPSLFTLLSNVDAGLEVLGEFPELGKLEVILSECDPDGWAAGTVGDNPNLFYRNTEYYASFVASSVNHLMDRQSSSGSRIDGMLTWAFLFENRGYFEGFRTLSTNGIDKPVLNVFRLLARLGPTRLGATVEGVADPVAKGRADSDGDPPTVSALAATDDAGAIQVFLGCHHDDWNIEDPVDVSITLSSTPQGTHYRVKSSMISRDSANAHTAWQRMGSPQLPTEQELKAMTTSARLAVEYAGETTESDNVERITLRLPVHSVCLLTFEAVQ